MEQTQINPLQLVTFGKSITRPEAIETIPAVNLMAMLQNGQWRKPIEAIRKEKNPKLQKEMKLRLPYFVYGALEGARSEENVRQVNGIVFDFDHVGDFSAAKIRIGDAAPWFRWLFRSPVDGLKLMIPFSRPVTDKAEYLLIWNLLKAEIEAKSGFKADNTPDLCRACFLSWDDDVLTCPEDWQTDLDEWLAEAEIMGKVEKKGKGEKVEDGVGRKVDDPVNQITGATDVPVGQGPEGLSGPKDKPLRGFANGDVCGSCNAADVCGATAPRQQSTDLDEVQAKSAVEYLAQRKLDRRDWIRCGIALFNHFGEDGIVYWLQFAYNPNYDDTPEDLRKVWERLKKYPGVNIGTLFYVAEQYGWINAVNPGVADVPVCQSPEGFSEPKDKLLRSFANGDVCGSGNTADACGKRKADVPVCQSPEGFSEPKDKLLRSFANGDVCGSGNTADACGKRKADVPVCQSPEGFSEPKDKLLRSFAGGDDCGPAETRDESQMNLADRPDESGVPMPRQNDARLPTLADFPELLELFRRPQNIHLDRDQLPREIVGYLDLVGRITDAQDGAKLTAFLPVVAANIGNRVYMYNAGTRHYCNIWAAIIGPSTVSRKTTVINQAMKMLQPFKDSLAELSPKERNEQDIELSRVTQARLYNLLAINPNRLILQMELSAWMREMGKSYNAGMKQEITDMFDGKDRSIAKMEIDEHIAKPAFSIVGATTEDWFFQELREVADQRGGFLQRFIICVIQNIDVNKLRLSSNASPEWDRELYAYDEILSVFRSLPGSHRLNAADDALALRDGIYADLMKRIALSADDPQAAYCARIFDNYFWRFCTLIHLLKYWQDLREARDAERLPHWFAANPVEIETAREAWYLCEYYFQNTSPFLRALAEGSRLDSERKVIRILQEAPGNEMTHSRLLCKSKMGSRDFRVCMDSLIEKQGVLFEETTGYNNRLARKYRINPVLINL